MKKTSLRLAIALIGLMPLQSKAQWQLSLDSCSSWSMVKQDTSVLAGTANGVYFSDNGGTAWTFKNCPATYVRSIVIKDSIIFITSDFNGVFKSLDNGITWTSINSGITNPTQAWSLSQNDSLLILGTSGSFAGDTASIYISSNNGALWTKVFSLGMFDVFYSFAVKDNEVFAGILPSGLYYSNDKGVTWTLHNAIISAKHIALSDTNLLCGVTGGTGGTYLSTDKGISWVNVLPVYYGNCFATSNNFTFTGNTNGFYYSIDNGYTWLNDNSGLPANTEVISICVIDSAIFIGTTNAEIYARDITEIVTGLNYWITPNPDICVFPNPTTNTLNIQYNFSKSIQFTLYNSLGVKIIDKILTNTTSTMNLTAYANDIYFYKVIADEQVIKSGTIIKQ